MITYKVLKHKTLEETFGIPHMFGTMYEIWHSTSPNLFRADLSIEQLKDYYKEHKTFMEQIDDYELLEVELKYINNEDNKQV